MSKKLTIKQWEDYVKKSKNLKVVDLKDPWYKRVNFLNYAPIPIVIGLVASAVYIIEFEWEAFYQMLLRVIIQVTLVTTLILWAVNIFKKKL